VRRLSKEKEKEVLELPLIFKYKGSSTEEREKTEQGDMESSRVMRLKELK
jgi:nicotinamide mononucleotide adenylyltransferase